MKRLLPLFLIFIFISQVSAQNKVGAVAGQIKDKQTGEGLPGASVVIKGTSVGEVTDEVGNFFLINVKEGKVIFQVSFIGYTTQEIEVMVEAQAINELNVDLDLDATTLTEVTVTSQALGQAGAINQQINSSSLMNVVSKDKIRELPDQNAAETVGRISGIYVQRDAGEGQKIVVRGLAPRFNNVTINGMRIPSTDPNDRSVDLSMVSPSMLSGIEVYKAARPDQDGDAIGGTVNFDLKKANDIPEVQLNLQSGYNQQANEFGQYKADLSASKRFIDDKIGVQFNANYQRANRSSDQLDGGWDFVENDAFGNAIFQPGELALTDIEEIRIRYGAGVTVDYSFSKAHNIAANAFYSATNRDELRRRRRYRVDEGRQEYDIRDRTINTGLTSFSLTGKHKLKKVELSWQGSYSNSVQEDPNTYETRFRETSAFDTERVDLTGQGLDTLVNLAFNRLDETFLNELSLEKNNIDDKFLAFQTDAKVPYTLGEKSGFIKIGVKYRNNDRTREVNRYAGEFVDKNSDELANFLTDFPTLYARTPSAQGIAISNFLTDPEIKDFLNGDYSMGPGETNGSSLSRTQTTGLINNLYDFSFNTRSPKNYLSKDYIADGNDYTTSEKVYAAYAMTELNLTKKLLLLAGLRYERTLTEYRGNYMTTGVDQDDGGAFEEVTIDSIGSRNYNEWLPMVHLHYKLLKWLDFRASVTKTFSRPDFNNLIPYRRINDSDRTINQANPQLRQSQSWNFDASSSLYNKYGLLTFSFFHKRITDQDYVREYRELERPYTGYVITGPANSDGISYVRGMEVDLQANFRFLPKPFNNFLLSANLTLLDSRTFYPYVSIKERLIQPPYSPVVNLNDSRTEVAQFQANAISNISLGYEAGGFSARLSMVYQGSTFTRLSTQSALDAFAQDNTRYDLALKQKITKNIKIYLNWNNMTNTAEGSFLGNSDRPTSEDYYGYTADVGVQITFN